MIACNQVYSQKQQFSNQRFGDMNDFVTHTIQCFVFSLLILLVIVVVQLFANMNILFSLTTTEFVIYSTMQYLLLSNIWQNSTMLQIISNPISTNINKNNGNTKICGFLYFSNHTKCKPICVFKLKLQTYVFKILKLYRNDILIKIVIIAQNITVYSMFILTKSIYVQLVAIAIGIHTFLIVVRNCFVLYFFRVWKLEDISFIFFHLLCFLTLHVHEIKYLHLLLLNYPCTRASAASQKTTRITSISPIILFLFILALIEFVISLILCEFGVFNNGFNCIKYTTHTIYNCTTCGSLPSTTIIIYNTGIDESKTHTNNVLRFIFGDDCDGNVFVYAANNEIMIDNESVYDAQTATLTNTTPDPHATGIDIANLCPKIAVTNVISSINECALNETFIFNNNVYILYQIYVFCCFVVLFFVFCFSCWIVNCFVCK